MEAVVEKTMEQAEESPRINLHDQDLVHELGRRLDALCRYAECIANAEGDAEVQQTWRDLERQELENIRNLKQLIATRMEKGEFLDDL
jgi:septal ring factor EnvC (AmiA/AmiB activator)